MEMKGRGEVRKHGRVRTPERKGKEDVRRCLEWKIQAIESLGDLETRKKSG